MSGTACILCNKEVEEALRIPFRECSHRIHADCFDAMPVNQQSYKKCGLCLGHIEAQPVKKMAETVSSRKMRLDGKDYIKNPGPRHTGSTLVKVASFLPGLKQKYSENETTSQNPHFLLSVGKEILDIQAENGLDLPHFCRVGVTMRDFMEHGYTWEDLQHFDDIAAQGKKRAQQAVALGLQATANDFRDFPEALPLEEVTAHIGASAGDMCRLFGLHFPEAGSEVGDPIEGGYLECEGDRNWRATDCVQLGLKFSDLRDFGLNYVHQYAQLFDGLSQREADAADKALGASEKDVHQLRDLEAELEAIEQERIQKEEKMRRKHLEMQQKMASLKQEYSSEDSESEEETPPPLQAYIAKKKPLLEPPRVQRKVAMEQALPQKSGLSPLERRNRQRALMHGSLKL